MALLCAVCLLPIGCSSGGGGEAVLTISALNAPEIATQTVDAADVLSEMSELAQQLSGTIESGSLTIPCSDGNLVVDVVDAPPLGVLSAGDSATITFNGCVLQLPENPLSLNGALTLTMVEATGSEGGPFTLELSAAFNALTVVSNEATFTVDGGFTVESSSTDGETVLGAVSGEYFSAFASTGGEAFSGTLRDFRLETTMNLPSDVYTMSLDAAISGSEIGGTVTFVTNTPFSGTEPGDPGDGSITVTGADDTSFTLIAVDETNVRIEVDTDGDGNPNVTINTTWDELD